MTAWLGAAILCLAGAGLGQLVARGIRQRLRELRAWQSALSALAGEVEYAARPLPAALREAGRAAGGTCRRALEEAASALAAEGLDAEAAWRRALAAACRDAPLLAEDVSALASLAPVLGRTGREDQLRSLALCARRLAAREAEAAERVERDARLAAYLCTLGSMALAVALV